MKGAFARAIPRPRPRRILVCSGFFDRLFGGPVSEGLVYSSESSDVQPQDINRLILVAQGESGLMDLDALATALRHSYVELAFEAEPGSALPPMPTLEERLLSSFAGQVCALLEPPPAHLTPNAPCSDILGCAVPRRRAAQGPAGGLSTGNKRRAVRLPHPPGRHSSGVREQGRQQRNT